jgi:hypothetical protein
VAEEATTAKATDEAMMKTRDQGAARVKATMELPGSGIGSSPAPALGTKRVATPSSSTPPSKQFCYAWKPPYVGQLYSHLLLFFYMY